MSIFEELLGLDNLTSLALVPGLVVILLAGVGRLALRPRSEPPKKRTMLKTEPSVRKGQQVAAVKTNESMQMFLMDSLAMEDNVTKVFAKNEIIATGLGGSSNANSEEIKCSGSNDSGKREHVSFNGDKELHKLRKTLRRSASPEKKADEMHSVQLKGLSLDQVKSKVQALTKDVERQEMIQCRIRCKLWNKKETTDKKEWNPAKAKASREQSNTELLEKATERSSQAAHESSSSSSSAQLGKAVHASSKSSSASSGGSRSAAIIPFSASEVILSPITASIHFKHHGVTLVQDALPTELAAEVAVFIDAELDAAQRAVAKNPKLEQKYFGSINERKNRWDLKIPLGREARAALRVLSLSLGPLFQNILVDGGASVMCELCCIVSDPGAKRQPLHPDTVIEDETSKGLVTTFIALQDVSREMGPTVVCPGTHCKEGQMLLKRFSSSTLRTQDDMIEAMGGFHACCTAGTALVMDSRLVHCGGANLDGQDAAGRGSRRRLLCISFAPVGDSPRGSTYSMRDEIKGKFCLDDFVFFRM